MPKENVVATVHTNTPAWMPGEKAEDNATPPPEPLTGWYVTLDREQLNRLIRSLRKARDAAFGADA